jgi:hypothetical protein
MLVVYGELLVMPVVIALPVAREHARRAKRERVVENMMMVE